MPRYDYKCANCEQYFELVQSFSEAGRGTCPACSGAGRRVYHAVPVIYKGSGFYTTDYGRPKRPVENGAKDGADGKSDPSETSSGGKESKTPAGESSSAGTDSNSESKAKATSQAGASA